MNRIFKHGGLAIVAALALLTAERGTAEEKKPAPAVEAKEVYHVYGYQCRRGVRLLGSYKTANEACWAAGRFRKESNLTVEVTTGTGGDYSFAAPAEFQVY